jgi:hypothetical protein
VLEDLKYLIGLEDWVQRNKCREKPLQGNTNIFMGKDAKADLNCIQVVAR